MIYLLLGSWKVFSTTAAKGLAVMEVSPQDNKRVSFKRKSSQYHRNMQIYPNIALIFFNY